MKRRRSPPWIVPFVLAAGDGLPPAGQPAVGRNPTGGAATNLRLRQADVAEHLRVLEAACWRGELGPRELALLQKLRVALAAADRAVDPGDDPAGGTA